MTRASDGAPPAAPDAAVAALAAAEPPVRHGRRRRRLGLTAGALAVFGLIAGFGAFVRAAIHPAPAGDRVTDGIVVLTGGSERVATGFRLLAAGQAPLLLISGAHPEAGLGEIATAAGLPAAPEAARVTIGHAAATTRGNAAEAAAWARAQQARSLRIVTAGYHMPRAMLEMRRAMPALDLVPHPVPSGALRDPSALRRPSVWALLAGEYGRLLFAWAGLSRYAAARQEQRDR